ncbi:2Fe-2S iron-sulfur cluster-binding protein [Paenibacillus allorhizosphaerae]|uniref:Na(+)-translocating NADH-quinone reductase subunit F n=1 Tax=Paenibacillus allorhizosphaerae TaxID=2849866 RepID=A0ABN7TMP1_9BACL|nr:2Fe-2S iron-sulfur cluster-binding protein [Paenibacillus allorhizosphaerae]CAG7641295.1 Na(+)-translocating NADH-quinone reductase subunit F [Paenibacillus allorhizosphaerae]
MAAHITFLPNNKTVQVNPGTTVLGAAAKAKVHIRTRCGGKAACLMCKVIVQSGTGLTAPNPSERMKLGSSDEGSGFRLACQAKILGDVTVTIPEDPLKAAIRKQLEKQQEEDW